MRYMLIISSCLLFWQLPASASSSLKEKVLQREMKRKISFEKHHQAKADRERKRRGKADAHTRVRLKREADQKKARLGFKRTKRAFPVVAWREFLEKKDEARKKHKIKRKNFIRAQKMLEGIKKTNKYKIDKNKEYQL